MSHSVNVATIEGMEKGVVTSASILVPCPWVLEFAAYARKHPDKDFGVHLTLTSEWKYYRWGPVAPRDKVPSLLDKEGYLWNDAEPAVAHARLNEAEIELRAQIDRARELGIPLSHLDTHMGTLLYRADLLELYVNLGIEYNLPVMLSREFEGGALEVRYPAIGGGRGRQLVAALDRHRLPVLSSVRMLYDKGEHNVRVSLYYDAFKKLPAGASEIIIHCGKLDPELTAITSMAMIRDDDRRIMTDPQTKAELARLGIQLTSWRELHAAIAKQPRK
jgi:chitin disaccharide deacetylase